MTRRPLRPAFEHGDKLRLIDVLRETRRQVLRCSAAESHNSDLYKICHAVTESLDDLAEALSGDRKILLSALHTSPVVRPKGSSSNQD